MSEEETNNNKSATTSVGRKTLPAKKPKKRRKISRRKPGQKSPRKYFTEHTQEAIVQYQQSDDELQKKQLYVAKILPAFDALVENLINVYGFKVTHESKEDLKNECLEFLYTTVHKFDATRNSKAFSYFNVVAKNWLTIKSKQDAKKLKQHVSLDDRESMSQADIETLERNNIVPGYDDVVSAEEMNKLLNKIVHELERKVRTDNEKATIEAIKIIIERLDDIDLLSKRAVLLYIREITGLSSKQLSIVLSSLKKHYRELRKLEDFQL